MRLSAVQERLQKNAVIVAARQSIYADAILKYGKGITVGDVTNIVTKGTTPKTYGFDFVQEGVPFLRAEEVLDGQVLYEEIPFHIDSETNDFMNRSRTQPGDVLVTIAGSIGRAAVVPRSAPELNMNQAVALIRCKDEINPYFLCHMLQSPEVQKQILSSTVTTAISNLSLGKIKQIIIPLPPLADQEAIAEFLEAVHKHHTYEGLLKNLPDYIQQVPRIVARIEELAARIEEARGLRREVRDDCEELCRSILSDTVDGASTLTPMRELVKLRELDITVSLEEIYWFAGIYSFGKGLFRGQRKLGTEFSYTRLTRLKIDNFVYPKLMAWEGAFAVVPPEYDGLVVSPEFPVFEIDQQRVLPETLEVYFHIPSVWSAVSGASTGTNVRRRRLNPADFLAFEIPLPPMKTQKRLREVKAKLDQMKQLQTETSAELDALLPSILDKAFKGEL